MARTLEGDALQDTTSILNHGISDQVQLISFGEAMSSANFVSDQTVKNIYVTSRGDSNYTKVSATMVAVRCHICTQRKQDMVTQKFNEFVLILHNELIPWHNSLWTNLVRMHVLRYNYHVQTR